MEQYRFDEACGKLYEWDEESGSYIFVASANGLTKEQTIEDYEEYKYNENDGE